MSLEIEVFVLHPWDLLVAWDRYWGRITRKADERIIPQIIYLLGELWFLPFAMVVSGMWVRHMRIHVNACFEFAWKKRGGGKRQSKLKRISERAWFCVCVHVFWQITWVPLHDETHSHKLRLSSVPLVKLRVRGLTYSCNCCYDWPNVQLSTNESTDTVALLHSFWPPRGRAYCKILHKYCIFPVPYAF